MNKLTVRKGQKGIIVHCPKCGHIFDVSINKIASELGSLGGLKRSQNMTQAERSRQASKASRARWDKEKKTVADMTTELVDKEIAKRVLRGGR